MKCQSTLFLFLCLIISPLGYGQVSVTLPMSGETRHNMCPGDAYNVVLQTRDTASMSAIYSTTIIFVSNQQGPITVRVANMLRDNTASLRFYDGLSDTSQLIATYHARNIGIYNITSSSGYLLLSYQCQGTDTVENSFSALVSEDAPGNYTVTNVTGVSADLNWYDPRNNGVWTIRYGTSANNLDQMVHARTRPYTLLGLNELQHYYFRVYRTDSSAIINSSQCPPGEFETRCDYERAGCIDYMNLTDCRVRCTYGAYGNPTQYYGVLDYGPSSSRSRHTVHTDRREWDRQATRNGDTLWTVPADMMGSVRLGNPVREGQSEQISYTYTVDTRIYDLLVLKYAVVLENPNHGLSAQPRFDFAIYDQSGNQIDPSCDAATFIPNYNMNGVWHTNGGVKWLDWNTLGLDLTPLNGQRIRITLTSRDCIYAGHWGYAYFALGCASRRISSLHCGADVSNTFHAPEGFTYKWFNTNDPGTILSTSRSLYVDRIGTYGCTMSFTGNNPAAVCEFTSTAVAGPRYPYAAFDTVCTDTVNCKFRFRFINNSVIAEDEARHNLTSYPCEKYEWVIDDTIKFNSTDLIYDFPFGTHNVKLRAMLSDGLCTDIREVTIRRKPVCFIYDTVNYVFCDHGEARLFDTVMNTEGRWTRDSADHIHTISITIPVTTYRTYYDTIPENDLLSYRFNGAGFVTDVVDTIFTLTNVRGCDSLLTYNLFVCRNKETLFDRVECDDKVPLRWDDGLFYGTDTQSFHYLRYCGGDSNVTLRLLIHPTYSNDFFDTICDNEFTTRSGQTFHTAGLHVIPFLSKDQCDSIENFYVKVYPTYHTSDHRVICSYDSLLWIDSVVYYTTTHTPYIIVPSINDCDSHLHLDLVVQQPVVANIGVYPNSASYSHPEITLFDRSLRSSTRRWIFPDGKEYNTQQVTFTYPVDEEQLLVTLIAIDTLGCADTTTRIVDMERASIWMPNIFTPELPSNNVLRITGLDVKEVKGYIFNRRGQLLFTYNSLDDVWDGTYRGERCPDGAYVYLINYTSNYNPKSWLKMTGTVLLVR